MENLSPVLTEIFELTTTIETKYPELYRFLDESPITIPSSAHPSLDSSILQDYLQNLKQLLKRHLETHKT